MRTISFSSRRGFGLGVGLVAGLALSGILAAGCKQSSSDEEPSSSQEVATAVQASAPASAATPSQSAKPPEKARPERPKEPLNVLLLTVDSLRADRMPWAGYERQVVPNIAKLAEKSVVYENAYSVSSYTAQSVATFLTGRYASTTYRSGVFFTQYSEHNVFFTEVLQEKGIKTIGWHGHMYFGRHKKKNLAQGFDEWELVPGITFNAQTDEHVTSEKMTKLGQELLGKVEKGQQFFAWAHYMDPHDEYKVHPESPTFETKLDGGRSKALNPDRYDSEIFYTDLWIGKLLDWAKEQPWWERTAVVISADHGEAFGEHGRHKHAFDVYEVLQRVPFIVYAPGVAARHVEARRTHIDLAPTVMDLMGQAPLEQFAGESLVPELYGKEAKERDYVLLELAGDSHNPQKSAIIKGEWKLISWNDGWKKFLYDLSKDPEEKQDLSKEHPEKLEEMWQLHQKAFGELGRIKPYGGNKLKSGGFANGPRGPVDD